MALGNSPADYGYTYRQSLPSDFDSNGLPISGVQPIYDENGYPTFVWSKTDTPSASSAVNQPVQGQSASTSTGGGGGSGSSGGSSGMPSTPKAVTGKVKKKMTVAGQLEGLLSSDSPYINEAEARAMQTANARGLLNSSIAASEGEKAAIQSALPIASQDASTYFNQSLTNQAAKNRMLELGYSGQLQSYLQSMNIEAQFSQLESQQAFTLSQNWLAQLASINQNPYITPDQRNHAISYVNSLYGAQGVNTAGANLL